MDYYDTKAILKPTLQNNELSYQTTLETLYTSPGLKKIGEQDGVPCYRVVRCPIEKACAVDIKAEFNPERGQFVVQFPGEPVSKICLQGTEDILTVDSH